MADKPAAPAADKGGDSAKKMNPQVVMLIKNQFWILGGIALLTAAVVWYMGVGTLDDQFKIDKQKNDVQFSAMKRLNSQNGTNASPNEFFAIKVNNLKKELNGQVVSAWGHLYERQTDKLSRRKVDLLAVNDKVAAFRDLILMEPDDRAAKLTADKGLRSEVDAKIQVYHNNQVLDDDFTDLFKILNIRHTKGIDIFGRPVDGVAADPKVIEGILVWNNAPFSPRTLRDRYRTETPPSIDRIAVTYEDIWTFRSLFSAINSINSKPIEVWLDVMKGKPAGDAPVDQANVPIKRIEFCDIAQWAMTASFDDAGDVQMNDPAAADAAAAAGGGGQSGFSIGNKGLEEETQMLLKGRYLDGRNAQVSDPSNPPFAEFRQMYVQLRVLMDQRLIPVLITECANAPLPIETRQVRVSMATVDEIRKQAAVAADPTAVQQSPHDAIVTVRGVVYIYTTPDESKLGQGSDPAPAKRDFGIPKRGDAALAPAFAPE